MTMMTRRAAVGSGLAAAALVRPRAARAQEHTFRFASLTPEGGYVHAQHLVPFKEAVERDSDGRILVDLQPAGVFGKSQQTHQLVESGVLDMCWTVQGYTSGRFPQSSVVELPFLYETAEDGTRILMGMFEEGLFERDYGSVKILALYTHRPYGLFTTEREVRTVEDMAGLKVRTPSAIIGDTLTAVGAVPVGLPVGEMAENLRRGVIEGSVFPFEAIALFGLEDQFRSLTDLKMAAPRFIVAMNRARYEGLPEDLRAVIDEHSGTAMAMRIATGLDAEEQAVKARYAAAGEVPVIDLDPMVREALIERSAPAIEAWVASTAADGVDAEGLLARAREMAAGS